MNQSNESKNWKDIIERILANVIVQTYIFVITNLVFFSKFSISSLFLKYLETPFKITVTDSIAILTVFVLAVGLLYYAGVYAEKQKEYRFINSPIKFMERLTIMGSTLIVPIILALVISDYIKLSVNMIYLHSILIMVISISVLSIFSNLKREDINLLNWEYHLAIYLAVYIATYLLLYLSHDSTALIISNYIMVLSLLVMLFGYETEKHMQKNYNLSLETIESDELEKDLDLFDITDIDYRFKKSDGNEIIVPIGRVQKITYKKTK